LVSLCCDDCRRPSWNKSNGHATDNPARRHSTPYFEVDLETGRRPTLVVEATARLAVAESVDLEHSRRSSSISAQAVYKPLGGRMSRRKVMPGRKPDSVEVRPRSLETDIPIEGDSSSRCVPTCRKKTGFIKLRSSGSSFRKRILTKKNDRSGFSRLNFMSRSRPKGCGDTTASQMQTVPLNSARMTPSSRRDSLYIFSHTDEPIVTPFAQILASLRKVRANFICLTNVHSSKDSRFGTSHAEEPRRIPCPVTDDPPNSLAVETLEELEWCLERLESIQTHRSVSDMASSKHVGLDPTGSLLLHQYLATATAAAVAAAAAAPAAAASVTVAVTAGSKS
uniref:3',5'-cyclic-AMP phosphodiesterase n=1 Tax=Hydatigena taeniaeformis TaxID=6205 RepID=A0A0R3WJI9_HYDTA